MLDRDGCLLHRFARGVRGLFQISRERGDTTIHGRREFAHALQGLIDFRHGLLERAERGFQIRRVDQLIDAVDGFGERFRYTLEIDFLELVEDLRNRILRQFEGCGSCRNFGILVMATRLLHKSNRRAGEKVQSHIK